MDSQDFRPPIEETQQPDPEAFRNQIFTREQMADQLSTMPRANAHPQQIRVRVLAPGEEAEGLTITADPGQEQNLDLLLQALLNLNQNVQGQNLGTVINIRRGSIIFDMHIESLDVLKRYKDEDQLKKLENILQTFLESRGLKITKGTTIQPDESDIKKLECFFSLKTLNASIVYAFCREEQQWYWSSDKLIWMRGGVFEVQAGKDEGKKPQEEDLLILSQLLQYKVDPRPKTPCQICLFKTDDSKLFAKMPNKCDLEKQSDDKKPNQPGTKSHIPTRFLLDKTATTSPTM